MSWDRPAGTVCRGDDANRGAHLHPEQLRPLTVLGAPGGLVGSSVCAEGIASVRGSSRPLQRMCPHLRCACFQACASC